MLWQALYWQLQNTSSRNGKKYKDNLKFAVYGFQSLKNKLYFLIGKKREGKEGIKKYGKAGDSSKKDAGSRKKEDG